MIEFIRAEWPVPPGVHAISTCRGKGGSQGVYHGLNLAMHVGDDPGQVGRNRAQLIQEADLPSNPCWLDQVHGHHVVSAAEVMRQHETPKADAVETRESGLVCAVMTADCLPVLLASADGQWVAAVHAGWRGLVGGVIPETLIRAPADCEVLAWLGPAIGPRAFEVGDEVRQVFMEVEPGVGDAFRPGKSGRWWADIDRIARLQLSRLGVDRVYGGGLCTWSDATRFYSYRRDGVTGRMASLIWRS